MVVPSSPEGLQLLRALAEANSTDLAAVEGEASELRVLARQTMAEIDRLSPQTNEAARKVRDMEAHIESYSRVEIRSVYSAARDSEMRLFMMQRQLEQLEYKLRNQQRYEKQLKAVVEAASHFSGISASEPTEVASASLERDVSPEALAEIVLSRDAERQKISRRLHDGPAQALANLVLRAEICERLFGAEPAVAQAELANIKLSIAKALEETRGLIFELRPMILDDLGPVPTLRRYAQALAERSAVAINLTVAGTERRLPSHLEVTVFSVTQEAMLNAVQHGHPSRVDVALTLGTGSVVVTVTDDGSGFDPSALPETGVRRQRIGLSTMRQLLSVLNGSFSLQSQPGAGTVVTAEIPIPAISAEPELSA